MGDGAGIDGVLGLLWFFHTLRTAIGGADAGFGWAVAALGLALVAAGGGVLAGPSGAQAFSDADFVGAPVAHALAQAAYAIMLGPGSLLLGLGVAVLSFVGRKTGVLVSWVAVVGFVAAALQVVAFIWIPSLAIPIWVLIASIVGFPATDRTLAT